MNPTNDDAANDARCQQLVAFDEALRLGREHEADVPADAELRETQNFLVYLQSVWKRRAKRIGPYTLVRNLGSGSVGPSYLVEEPATKQLLVLRILWPDLNANPQLQRKVLAEAKAAQLLQHSGVIRVRQARVAGSVCMFVSGYNKGPSLAEWRGKQTTPMPWEAAVAFVANLADIVEYAHSEGFAHGNLKPSNIFLPDEQRVTMNNVHQASIRIGEFGLAKAVLPTRWQSQSSLPWPMPHYLAPEQLARQGKPADLSSDLYALGVLLYELMTNRSPAQGVTREEIFSQTRDGKPVPPRQLRPDIPEDVSELVMKCLSKQPQQRHRSAKLLADACRALLPGAIEPKATPAWWRRWLPWG